MHVFITNLVSGLFSIVYLKPGLNRSVFFYNCDSKLLACKKNKCKKHAAHNLIIINSPCWASWLALYSSEAPH